MAEMQQSPVLSQGRVRWVLRSPVIQVCEVGAGPPCRHSQRDAGAAVLDQPSWRPLGAMATIPHVLEVHGGSGPLQGVVGTCPALHLDTSRVWAGGVEIILLRV